jgi:hypothetical protein
VLITRAFIVDVPVRIPNELAIDGNRVLECNAM